MKFNDIRLFILNYLSVKVPDTNWLIYKLFFLFFLDFFYLADFIFEFVWSYLVVNYFFFFILLGLVFSFFSIFFFSFFNFNLIFLQSFHSYFFILTFSFLSLFYSFFSVNSIIYYNFIYFDFFLYDDFSYGLVVLTSFLYALIFKYYNFNTHFNFGFLSLLIFSFYILILTFSVSRIFHFYIFFEAILLPFFFLISLWGSNFRRIWAAERLLFFTLFLSVPFFYFVASSFFLNQTFFVFNLSFNFFYFTNTFFSINFFLISSLFFLGVKIPLFPVHIWLPEAHGEAPTLGSIILAGLLLKLGAYGFYRFFFFSNFSFFYSQNFFLIIYIFSIASLFSSLSAIFFQLDFKKAIAYFSIAHIAYVVLGILTSSYEGLFGSLIITISHGLSATALFFLVGFLYNQTHTRSIYFYSQLAQKIPIFSIFFFVASLANVSLPGTTGFVGEQIVLLSLIPFGFDFIFLPIFFTIFSGFTGMLFCFKLLFGSKVRVFSYFDFSSSEIFFSCLLLVPIFLIGFFPTILFI